MTVWPGVLAAAVAMPLTMPLAGIAAVVMPGPAGAQQTREAPPEPAPPGEIELPPVEERTLSNGARLLVVSRRGMPFVTVDLVLPGGRTADPAGRTGLADLTAALLARGSESRTAAGIEEALDHVGAELEASAGTDWTTVSVGAVTPDLPAVLELMADVVLRPGFPARELERVRTAMTAELEAGREGPVALADRAFLRAVYGAHPYGRGPTPETLRAVDRAAVVDFHRTWYRPGRALFVVAGDVAADRAEELLERAFGGWEGGAPPGVAWGLPPLRHAPEVVVVHRPGADRTVLRVGHTLARGDDPEWTRLSVLGHVVGGGPGGRLSRAFRGRGLGPVAVFQLQRRLDRGFFRVAAEVRTEVAGVALDELRTQLLRLRDEPVSIAELREARDVLAGTFLLQIETAPQLAGQLTTARLLGVPYAELEGWPERVRNLGVEDLREAARARIHPDELVAVVVGDAARLHGQLGGFGSVTVVDARGDPVDVAALVPAGRSEPLDASVLRPARVEYRVTLQGRPVGTVVRSLEDGPGPGTMVYRGVAQVGPETVSQSVTFTIPAFEPVAADARTEAAGARIAMDVRVREGRAVGTLRGPGPSETPVDRPLPRAAVLGDMVDLVLWMTELEEGKRIEVPLLDVESGAVGTVLYRVGGVEEVSVPAGVFPARRVEVGGPDPRTVWLRPEAPHVPLRIEQANVPVVLELTSPVPFPPGG